MNKKNIIIIILIILIIGLTGFIVYDKVLSDNKCNQRDKEILMKVQIILTIVIKENIVNT